MIISLLAIVASIFVLISAGVIRLPEKANEDETVLVPETEEKQQTDQTLEKYRKTYQENKAINPDYVGEIVFDSGLIEVPFVQAKSVYKEDGTMYEFYTEDGRLVQDPENYTGNDVYIWTYWATGEYDYNDHGGSTFMDYRNELSDQNLIIYGHHFSVWNDEERIKAFTPLEKLLEKENYAENRFVDLALGNEVRRYEIAAVYQFDATKEEHFTDLQYWRTNYNYDDYHDNAYDSEYYANYIKAVKKAQLYDTGVSWTTDDKTLTLQTCIGGHAGELFEIIVLKQISSQTY